MKNYFKKKVDTAKRVVAYSDLKNDAQFLKSTLQNMWGQVGNATDKTPRSIDSLGLSEEALSEMKRMWTILLTVFLCLLGFAVLFLVYNLVQHNYWVSLISIALICLFAAQSFKYHFSLFQLKQGKLGCTWREWSESLFKKSIK
jgi:intracellular multiplication protein IcmV